MTKIGSTFPIRDLSDLHYFLDMEIITMPNGMLLSQSKYITDLLQKFQMANCKPCLMPMATTPPLTKNSGEPFHDGELYRQLIDGLQYITITRPDLAYSVNKLCQYMHSPTTSHW